MSTAYVSLSILISEDTTASKILILNEPINGIWVTRHCLFTLSLIRLRIKSLYSPKLHVRFALLVAADDAVSLSESDLKVIFLEVEVKIAVVALLTELIKLSCQSLVKELRSTMT